MRGCCAFRWAHFKSCDNLKPCKPASLRLLQGKDQQTGHNLKSNYAYFFWTRKHRDLSRSISNRFQTIFSSFYFDIVVLKTCSFVEDITWLSASSYLNIHWILLFQTTMELFVSPTTYFRSKLKFFRTRQAIFIYVATFYLMFLLLHKQKFVPGAEFSNNKEWFRSWVNLRVKQTMNWPWVNLVAHIRTCNQIYPWPIHCLFYT